MEVNIVKYKLCPYKKYIHFKAIKDSYFLFVTIVALVIFNKFGNHDFDRGIIKLIILFQFVLLLDVYNSSLKETIKNIREVYPVFLISRRKILNRFFLQKESTREIDLKYFVDVVKIDDKYDEESFLENNKNLVVLSRKNNEVEVVDLNSPFGGIDSRYDFLNKVRSELMGGKNKSNESNV